jgi:hypothetical protein
MKKLVVVLIMTFITILSYGQDINTESTEFVYCQIISNTTGLKGKPNIKIDFGKSEPAGWENINKDPSTGKPYDFNSNIDALNFMAKQGWELVQSNMVGDYSPGFTYFYILRKKVEVKEKS